MKKHMTTAFTAFCLIICIVAASIDWSFMWADAEEIATEEVIPEEDYEEETVADSAEEPVIEEVIVDSTEEATMEEEEPAAAEEAVIEEAVIEESAIEEPAVAEPAAEEIRFLHASAGGFSADFYNGGVFQPGDSASIAVLGRDELDRMAGELSEMLDGQTATAVSGFSVNASCVGNMLDICLSGGTDDVLYRHVGNGYERVMTEKDGDGCLLFQTPMSASYLFVKAGQEELAFSYSDGEVVVTAVCNANSGIPADAQFHADKLKKGSMEYQEAYDVLAGSMEIGEGQTLTFLPYDVYFIYNGKRIEPEEGMVQVSMKFTSGLPMGDGLFSVHIKEDGEVELPETEVSGGSVSFAVDSFSVMGIAALSNIEEEAYAILYSDGTMVFQRGNATDSSHGSVVGAYTGFETKSYTSLNDVPWYCNWTSIKKVIFTDTIQPISTAWWFACLDYLTEADLSGLDTSYVTDMNRMFYMCSNLTSLDVSGFDTSSVTNMLYMFIKCQSLTSLDVSGFDTSSVTNMSSMFKGCQGLTSLDVSGFDTSSVTNMSSMFGGCQGLTSLDVSGFDTSSVTNMSSMFEGCQGLTSLDVSGFDMSFVTDMSYMFSMCESLTSLNISGFNMARSANIAYMFRGCQNLLSLDVSGLTNASGSHVFDGCDKLAKITVNNFPYSQFNYDIFKRAWLSENSNTGYANFYNWYTNNKIAGTYVKATLLDSIYGSNIYTKQNSVAENLPVPETIGRKFIGWFTEKDGGTQLQEGDTLEQDSYYAHWEDYSYNLVFDPNGGDGEKLSTKVGYRELYQLPGAIYEYEGQDLISWNTRKDGSGKTYLPGDSVKGLSSEDGGTVTLYAQWESSVTKYTVSFDTADGELVPAISAAYNSTITLPVPVKDHFTFKCWSASQNGGTTYNGNSTYRVSRNVTLYAQWFKNPVVTFDTQGHGPNLEWEVIYINKNNSDYYGTIYVLPEPDVDPSSHCSFVGWFKADGTKIDSSLNVPSDMTVYAHWGWQPKFDAAGGKITTSENFLMQEDSSYYMINTLPSAEYDGHTFDGWYWNGEKLSDGCTLDLSQGNVIEARWTKLDTVTVTFVDQSKTTTYICSKGGTLAFPAGSTTVSNYVSGFGTAYAVFLGWADDSGRYWTEDDVFNEDVTLTAQYQQRDMILTFDADGGSGISGTGVTSGKMCVPSGTTLFTLPGAKKTNYILEGWYTEKNGGGQKLTTDTVITGPATYYANWVPFFMDGSDGDSVCNYGAEWSNASNANMTNLDDTLEMHPTSTSSQTASLHVRFELNKTVASGEDLVLPVGSVRIRVPKYIWKDWDGNNTGSNNISSSLVKYPNTNSQYFSYTEEGDDYVLINSKELSGTAGMDLTISYTVSPKNVPGGASDINGAYVDGYGFYKGAVPVTFTIDTDLDGTAESEATKELSVEMHTTGKLSGYKKVQSGSVTYLWNSDWGKEPSDADSYFFIKWYIERTVSGTQDFSDISFTEGIHDGTIVYSKSDASSATIVTKHPMSLLTGMPTTGITLSNEASINGTLKSGYEMSYPVTGSITVYPETYPTGTYKKDNGSTSVKTINGGQETILDDGQNIQLDWRLQYSGGFDIPPVWNETMNTYSVPKYTVRIKDGVPGNVMYSSGSASSPYIWEPDTGNVALTDSDYCFSELNIQVDGYDGVYKNGIWTFTKVQSTHGWDTFLGFDLYVRHARSDDFVFYNHYTSDVQSLTFSDTDIVGFEVQADSNYCKTNVYVDATMQLKPTNHVKMLLQDDVDIKATSVIKNSSVCDIWETEKGEDSAFFHVTDNTGGETSAGKNCYVLNVSTTKQYTKITAASQTSVMTDAEHDAQDTPMWIGAYNYNTGYRVKNMRSGIFYNLLPKGTSVDPDTIIGVTLTGTASSQNGYPDRYSSVKNSSHISRSSYDVQFVQNWEGSGRTMMTITYALPDTATAATGMGFYYLLHNTYENVMEHGTTVENDVAFVNTTKNAVHPDNIYNALSTITYKEYYQSLENANTGNIGYAKASANYIPVDAYSWGFTKSVQTVSEYENLGEVLPNNVYTYRLSYSQSDSSVSRDLVFFDVLEGGSDTKADNGTVQHNSSEWHGVLQYVDTGAASSKLTEGSTSVKCSPVIYYSTKDRGSFTDSDWDVSNTATWTRTKPADAASITAVAIDCSKNTDGTDFVMTGKQSLEMYIGMRAPTDMDNIGKTAYNEGVIWARHASDEAATPEYDSSAVTIRDVEPELHKASTPETGTERNPADAFADDVLEYDITVTNSDEVFTLNNIVVQDTIQTGLSIDYDEIMVHFGNRTNALKVESSPRVSMKRVGRTLTFTISSLLPGETVHIVVPTIVMIDSGIIKNTAHITSINGIGKDIDSETTWHEAQPMGLVVKKTDMDGNGVAGAKLQLTDLSGNVVYEWTSTGKADHIDAAPGDYYVKEIEPPAGYYVNYSTIHVTLAKNGFMYVNGTRVSPVVLQDKTTKITVDKTGPEGEDVIGAVLEIYEIPEDYTVNYVNEVYDWRNGVYSGADPQLSEDIKNGLFGEPVYSWVHDGTEEIRGILSIGTRHVLYEKEAPEGYGTAEPLIFGVFNSEGLSGQHIEMKDPYAEYDINVSKCAGTADTPLSGASMAIFKAQAHVHDYVKNPGPNEWTAIDSGGSLRVFTYDGSKWTSQIPIAWDANRPASGIWTTTLSEDMDVTIRYGLSENASGTFMAGLFSGTYENPSLYEMLTPGMSDAGSEVTYTRRLPAGSYLIQTVYSKEGYAGDDDDYGYIIFEGGSSSDSTWTCMVCGNTVEDESEAVNGPAYEADETDSSFEPVRWTSGEAPQTVPLMQGTYILREEAAPDGWLVHEDIPFSITPDGKVVYEQDSTESDKLIMIDEIDESFVRESGLSVLKTVKGSMGDKTKAFKFRIELKGATNVDLETMLSYTLTTDGTETESGELAPSSTTLAPIRKPGFISSEYITTAGTWEFELAHNQQITFTLPCGTEYVVTELDGEEDGYTVESSNAEGTTDSTDTEVRFTNTKGGTIPTGVTAASAVTTMMAAFALAAAAFLRHMFLRRRKMRQ